eukprot:gene9923-12168_t
MTEVYSHINQINDCINSENGTQLAQIISMSELLKSILYSHPNYPSRAPTLSQQNQARCQALKKLDFQVRKITDIDNFVYSKFHTGNNQLNQSYSELVSNRLQCISTLLDQNYTDSFKLYSEAVSSFLKIFELWSSPVLWKLCYDLRLLAWICNLYSQQQQQQQESSKKLDYFEEASRLLSKCFQSSISDRTANITESKRNSTMGVINQMFQIYFQINNLKLCKNLIKTIESQGFPPLESYPLPQLITYRFFNGRLSSFDGNYKKAQLDLLFAFNKCPNNYIKNKRLILLYLIPMQLAQCKFPKKQLLVKYNLPQFQGIVESIKSGNIKQFNQCMATYQNFFIAKGIYLILEKLKIIVYRNLFKKVHLITTGIRIPIGHFVAALRWMENDSVDIDEAECLLANLIYNGYLKGYISHKVGLVVSPTNPFPKLPLA